MIDKKDKDPGDQDERTRDLYTPQPVQINVIGRYLKRILLRLDVHFLGKENIDFRGVRQSTSVVPGRYRFSADVSAQGLSSDQGPLFQIVDAENPGRLSVESKPMLGTISRSSVTLDFVVPAATQVLTVQLVRRPSQKFDSKISGKLHIYATSLQPLR